MKIIVEDINNVKKKIKIEIPKERVSEEIDRAYREFRKNVAIKGFRKGKAPRSIVERLYKNEIDAEVISKLIRDSYQKALDEKQIIPLSNPVVIDRGVLEKESDFVYSALVEVKPDIEVKNYKGIEIDREEITIKEEEIDNQLKILQESNARLDVINEDRGIVKGDYVLMDVSYFVGNKLIRNEKDLFLEINSNNIIPEFEDAIVGLKKGDNKTIAVDIPEDYHSKEIAGKRVTFKIKIKEIKKKILPELDDDFAKDLGDYDNISDLREKIRERLEELEKIRIDNKIKNDILNKIIELNPFDLPESLVERERDRLLEEWSRNSGNMNKAEDVEKVKSEFEEIAKNRIKASLIIEAIAKKESIEVTEDDIERKLKEIAERSNKSIEAVKGYYSNRMDSLKNILIEEKTLDFLIETSNIKEKVR
jgi:trigger factor